MLTVTSSKFSKPEPYGNRLLRLICKKSGDELFVRKCKWYDECAAQMLRFDATTDEDDQCARNDLTNQVLADV